VIGTSAEIVRRPSRRHFFGLLAPQVHSDTTITFDPTSIGPDVAAYLAAREAQFPGIRQGLEKEIVWADPARRHKTPLAVVYVHGLAACKEETRPLADDVARTFGANLFFTRLAGHALPAEVLAKATLNQWINDLAEAMEVGRRIGERVLVIATSTGAAITAWMALERGSMREGLAGLVLMSPNFKPPGPLMTFVNTPVGARLLALRSERWNARVRTDLEHAHAWTRPIPISAVLSALAASHLVYRADPGSARIPTLFIYSQRDCVVFPKETDALFEAWGSDKERFLVTGSRNPTQHVIAGRLRSPETTDLVVGKIVDWLRRLGMEAADHAT